MMHRIVCRASSAYHHSPFLCDKITTIASGTRNLTKTHFPSSSFWLLTARKFSGNDGNGIFGGTTSDNQDWGSGSSSWSTGLTKEQIDGQVIGRQVGSDSSADVESPLPAAISKWDKMVTALEDAGRQGQGKKPFGDTLGDLMTETSQLLKQAKEPGTRGSHLSESDKAKIYTLHNGDPEVNTVEKLARDFKIMRQRVHAILWLKKDKEEREKKLGHSLNNEDNALESSESNYREFHVASLPYKPAFKVMPEDWDGMPKDMDEVLYEISKKEDDMCYEEFLQKFEFNMRKLKGEIKCHKHSRRREDNGWKLTVEKLGPRAVKVHLLLWHEYVTQCRGIGILIRITRPPPDACAPIPTASDTQFVRPSILRPFTSSADDSSQLAHSLSAELLKNADVDSVSIQQRLQLSFSHVKPSHTLIHQVLDLSSEAGRSVLGFQNWVHSHPAFTASDETYACFINYFGRRKDFKAVHDVLLRAKGIAADKTFVAVVDRFVRAGRPSQLVSFFEKMEVDYGLGRSRESLTVVIEKLCEHGFASYAEKMVKSLANEFFPNEKICDLLIKGWCNDGKLDEAKRLAGEMDRGGFEIGAMAYNSILDCVCKLCRAKDPFSLQSEAEKILIEMDVAGVPRDVETFNVLIDNLCKIRRTEDALNLFHRMGEWGCHPNAKTFLTLTKSLYQAARIGEGDEMIDRMKSAGHEDQLDKKEYYEFLKVLCGIERIDHALSVFTKMKDDGCKPGVKTYDLLMGKLVAHGRVDKANSLFNEASKNGVPVEPKAYKKDPRFASKKPVAVKKVKKRETLPEKTARKKRTLQKIRLSFVKKPRKGRRRTY
ncbi:unnamed protein product [Rhodiola kirilowii]